MCEGAVFFFFFTLCSASLPSGIILSLALIHGVCHIEWERARASRAGRNGVLGFWWRLHISTSLPEKNNPAILISFFFFCIVRQLLKAQTKYLGRNWRKSNMKTMSAIYQRVRHRLNDDWAYGNGKCGRGSVFTGGYILTVAWLSGLYEPGVQFAAPTRFILNLFASIFARMIFVKRPSFPWSVRDLPFVLLRGTGASLQSGGSGGLGSHQCHIAWGKKTASFVYLVAVQNRFRAGLQVLYFQL